jgi:hypothetical protein
MAGRKSNSVASCGNIVLFFRPPGLKVPTKVKVGLPFCSAEKLIFSLSFFNRFCPFRFFFYIANNTRIMS